MAFFSHFSSPFHDSVQHNMSGTMSIAERIKMMQNQAAEPTKPAADADKPQPKRLSVAAMSIPIGLNPASPRHFTIGGSSGTTTPLGSGARPMFTPSHAKSPETGSLNLSRASSGSFPIFPPSASPVSSESTPDDAGAGPRRGSVAALGRSLNIPLGGMGMMGMMGPRSAAPTPTSLNALPENRLTVNPDSAEAPKINHFRRATLSSKNRRRASTLRGPVNLDIGDDTGSGIGSGETSVSNSGSFPVFETSSLPDAFTPRSRGHSRRVSIAASFETFVPLTSQTTAFSFNPTPTPTLNEAPEEGESLMTKISNCDGATLSETGEDKSANTTETTLLKIAEDAGDVKSEEKVELLEKKEVRNGVVDITLIALNTPLVEVVEEAEVEIEMEEKKQTEVEVSIESKTVAETNVETSLETAAVESAVESVVESEAVAATVAETSETTVDTKIADDVTTVESTEAIVEVESAVVEIESPEATVDLIEKSTPTETIVEIESANTISEEVVVATEVVIETEKDEITENSGADATIVSAQVEADSTPITETVFDKDETTATSESALESPKSENIEVHSNPENSKDSTITEAVEATTEVEAEAVVLTVSE